MRAGGHSVIVPQLSDQLRVSLRCYHSLAARAYVVGVARDVEVPTLRPRWSAFVLGAFAPLTLKPDLMTALRANRSGYTLEVQNPNLLPLTVKSVSVVLPPGFRYLPKTTTGMTRSEPTVSGRTLTWSLTKVVGPRQQGRLHLRVRTPQRLGTYGSTAAGLVETAAGNQLAPQTPAVALRVKKRISAIAFRVHAPRAGGSTVSGGASARFRAGAKASSVVAARGSLLLQKGDGRRLLLKAKELRLQRLAGPTRARLTLRIVSARGLHGCRVGSSATLLLVYSPDLRSDETSSSYLTLSLPRACGGTLRRPAEITASAS